MKDTLKNILKDFPTRKDLFYWLLISLLFTIVVSVWKTNNPGMLVDQISLGGTFLSILLAVVAIIFSFVQSNETSRSSFHIIERIGEVAESISALNGLKSELTQTIEYQKRTANEVAKGLEEMKNATDDSELKSKAEKGLIVWKEVQEKIRENEMNYDLSGGIYVRNSQHEKLILDELSKRSPWDVNHLIDFLRYKDINYDKASLIGMLNEMNRRKLLSLDYKTNEDCYVVTYYAP